MNYLTLALLLGITLAPAPPSPRAGGEPSPSASVSSFPSPTAQQLVPVDAVWVFVNKGEECWSRNDDFILAVRNFVYSKTQAQAGLREPLIHKARLRLEQCRKEYAIEVMQTLEAGEIPQ